METVTLSHFIKHDLASRAYFRHVPVAADSRRGGAQPGRVDHGAALWEYRPDAARSRRRMVRAAAIPGAERTQWGLTLAMTLARRDVPAPRYTRGAGEIL